MIKKGIKFIYLIIGLLIILGCGTNMVGVIVRHDFTIDDIDYLYVNMKKDDILKIYGLPHKSNSGYITTYYYYTSEIVLKLNIIKDTLIDATLFYKNKGDDIMLPKKAIKEIEIGKYTKNIKKEILYEDIGFITDKTTSLELQEIIGAPIKYEEYKLPDGVTINSFIYDLEGNKDLYILFTYNGTIGRAWIQNGTEEEVVLVDVDA